MATRLTEPDQTIQLRETLEWAKKIRADGAQSTTALQLADELIDAIEALLEAERFRQEQMDRFMGITELGPAH